MEDEKSSGLACRSYRVWKYRTSDPCLLRDLLDQGCLVGKLGIHAVYLMKT